MDGEVIDTLLGLLNQRVAKDFPREILRLAIDFFQRLINRHRANGNWTIADYPLSSFMNILAGRKIHYRITAPADGPGHLLDFFLNARTKRRITNVGIDLRQK